MGNSIAVMTLQVRPDLMNLSSKKRPVPNQHMLLGHRNQPVCCCPDHWVQTNMASQMVTFLGCEHKMSCFKPILQIYDKGSIQNYQLSYKDHLIRNK